MYPVCKGRVFTCNDGGDGHCSMKSTLMYQTPAFACVILKVPKSSKLKIEELFENFEEVVFVFSVC